MLEGLVGFVYSRGECFGAFFVGLRMEVWMSASLELEEFAFQSGEIDSKGCIWWWAGGEGIGEEGVVCLRGLLWCR